MEEFENIILLFLLSGVFLFIYITQIFGKISRKTKQFDKTDFIKNKGYYREILDKYSTLVIGYMDNLELDKKSIIAELLYLKSKKIIDIKNGKIEVNNYNNIFESQKLIINQIVDGKLKINNFIFIYDLRNIIEKEAEKLLLVKLKWKKTEEIQYAQERVICVITGILIILFLVFICIFQELTSIIMLIFAGLFMIVLYMITGIAGYELGKGNIYKRTAKGRELNQKLEGLKNYLRDYSLMDERESKEIELWDDYLIYSVMFGHNKKIIEEYEKYIEIIE